MGARSSIFASRRRAWIVVCVIAVLVTGGVLRWYQHSPRPNIILVTFDTTRADHIGSYGYEEGLTTAFDDFASRGVVFERAYAPCPITLPSHATMLTGLYPPEHDLRVNGSGRLSSQIPFLPDILKQHGYDTGAFIAAAPVLGAQFGLDRGFDRYDDDPARLTSRTRAYGGERRDGEEVVNLALEWLKQRNDKPFFCWIHLYDAHGPYDPYSDVYQDRFEQNPYDAGVAWEVQQFSRVNDYLKEQQLDSNTVVIVAGDHGEGLDDHGEHEHGMLVYNSTLHVPLAFAGPLDIQPGTRVNSVVSLVDLMPTLLDMLSLPMPEHISGRSLLPALKGEPIESRDCYAEAEMPYFLNRWSPLRSVISDHWKYIQTTRPELYNLKEDPGELNNLIESDNGELARLEDLLADMQASFSLTSSEAVELSEQDLANLQALGYVGGTSAPESDDPSDSDEELIDMKDMIEFVAKFEEAKHIASGDRMDEAIALLQEVADATDKYPLSDMRLADLLASQRRFEEAVAIYRSVIERRPDFVKAYITLGRVLVDQGLFEEAESHLREFTQAHPEDANGHMHLAHVLPRLQKFDEAVEEYYEALRLSPGLVPARIALGQLLMGMRRLDEAVPQLEKVLEYDPNNFIVYQSLMMAQAQSGQLAQAIQTGKKATSLNPNSFETRFNLGVMLLQSRQLAEGIAQLREAQRIRPDDPRPAQQIEQAEAAMRSGAR